jgi:hypothetical protein
LSQPDYTNRNANFYGPLDRDDPENVAHHLRQIRTSAIDLGFTGIFDVALEAARSEVQEFRDDKLKFMQNGELTKLYRFCRPGGSRRMIPVDPLLRREVCDAATEVYAQEWGRLLSYSGFRTPFGKFAVDYIESFSFARIYVQMLSLAPCLFALLAVFTTTPLRTPKPGKHPHRPRVDEKFRQRVVVMAIAILANLRNQHVNVVQCFITFYLYASNVPKRVIAVLNHLGISSSYTSLKRALSANKDSMAAERHAMTARSNAGFINYDNLQKACNVRDETIFNKGGFLLGVVAYQYEPPPSRCRPMFTPNDCDYSKFQSLSAKDFLPSDSHNEILESAFRCMIWDTVRTFAEGKETKLPNLLYPMPSVHQIDHSERPKILTLPFYNLDEKKGDHVIKIHQNIASDIGLSDEQKLNHIVQCRGDLYTIEANRFS